MGDVIEMQKLSAIKGQTSRLLIYCRAIQGLKTFPLDQTLAEQLIQVRPKRRSMRLETYFNKLLAEFPDDCAIQDFDVMFNPDYQVDVLKILIEARKHKRFQVIWPGKYENGKLTYSLETYPDYKVYDIEDYDVTCIV